MSRTEQIETSIAELSLHRENLQACETFWQFKVCQIAFVSKLISDYEGRLQEARGQDMIDLAMKLFVDETDFVTKIKTAVGGLTGKSGWSVVDDPPAPNHRCPNCDTISGAAVQANELCPNCGEPKLPQPLVPCGGLDGPSPGTKDGEVVR